MSFAAIDTWLFDLDNTLYPASADLFAHIDRRMGAFISKRLEVGPVEARRIQKKFFHEHGTTLRGLMDRHGVDPHEFLDFVHDIEMEALAEDPAVSAGVAALPGRKLVFTNGDAPYALKVLERLGLHQQFEAIHDIHAMDYRPKPDPRAYEALVGAHGIAPERAVFVEDMARNLVPAKALGMTTVWLDNGSESASLGADWGAVDHRIDDLGAWLTSINSEREAA